MSCALHVVGSHQALEAMLGHDQLQWPRGVPGEGGGGEGGGRRVNPPSEGCDLNCGVITRTGAMEV